MYLGQQRQRICVLMVRCKKGAQDTFSRFGLMLREQQLRVPNNSGTLSSGSLRDRALPGHAQRDGQQSDAHPDCNLLVSIHGSIHHISEAAAGSDKVVDVIPYKN
ncbi:MAG TPA: hypothetical protein VGM11_05970 [Acidobacteriaceae bacterium]